jgi:hypothetical protein
MENPITDFSWAYITKFMFQKPLLPIKYSKLHNIFCL